MGAVAGHPPAVPGAEESDEDDVVSLIEGAEVCALPPSQCLALGVPRSYGALAGE